jgi:predicted lipoprotein with Yx(FWY)xxD motif
MVRRANVMFSRAAFTGLLAVAAACGGSSGGSSTDYGTPDQSGGPPAQSATLMIATDARLGSHLVDGNGRSLYYFAKDVPAGATQAAISNCNAGCLPIWPIFNTDSVVAQGINATDVGQITRSDGSKQTTYKGFPLYYYAGDTAAGDTNGEGVNGIWYVVHDPTYSITLLSKANEAATYLTDGAGRALYSFALDTAGTASTAPVTACTSAQCMTNWPIFQTDQVTVPSDLDAADFTVYTRADGSRQSAYKGHPLYYYVGDTAPGETNGRGVPNWQTIDPTAL